MIEQEERDAESRRVLEAAGIDVDAACGRLRTTITLCAELLDLKAKLTRVEALPAKWRDAWKTRATQSSGIGYADGVNDAEDRCADELEAALRGETPEVSDGTR